LPPEGKEFYGDDISYKRSTGEAIKATIEHGEDGRFYCNPTDGGEGSILTREEIRCYENDGIAYARVLPSRSQARRRFQEETGPKTGGNREEFTGMTPDAQEVERERIDQREMEKKRQAKPPVKKKFWQFWK
jgi:hypothetical protein